MLRHRAQRLDEGFTLVEVVVATALFVAMSTATVAIVVQGLKTLRQNADRVMAASVARSAVEYWRAKGATGIPLGLTEWKAGGTVAPIPADSTFVIRTQAEWVGFNQTSSSCSAASPGHAFVRVSVEVTTVNLDGPLKVDTVVVPDAKQVLDGKATVKVTVTDPLINKPVDAATVKGTDATNPLNNFTYLTGADGCILLQGLTAGGTLSIDVSKSSNVSSTGAATTTKSAPLTSNGSSSLSYLIAPQSTVSWTTGNESYPLAALMPLTYQVNVVTPVAVVGRVDTSVSQLWPGNTISAFAGKCTQANPGSYSQGQTTYSLIAGQNTVAALPIAPVKLRGLNANMTVTAHEADSGCTMTDVVLGRSDSRGILQAGLPYGKWDIYATGSAPLNKQTVTVTLVPPVPPAVLPPVPKSFPFANLDLPVP